MAPNIFVLQICQRGGRFEASNKTLAAMSLPLPLTLTAKPSHPTRWPGVALCAALAAVSLWAAGLSWPRAHGLGALTLAIGLGLLLGNLLRERHGAPMAAGIAVCKQQVLRLGIVLYGLRLTFQQVAEVGAGGVLIDALVLSSTFALAGWAGPRWFGLEREAAMLVGAGSAICGAAAVMAAGPVLRARAEQGAFAVATVVLFGTLAMFGYPLLYRLGLQLGLGWDPVHFGVFTGSTVHEVAQVVVAGQAIDEPAAAAAVITKMVRVMMLAPFLLALSAWRSSARTVGEGAPGIVVPWFAFGFLLLTALNSLHPWPASWRAEALRLDDALLAMAMAGLGLTTRLGLLREAGARPLLLAALLMAWLLLGGGAINAGVNVLLG